MIEIGESRRLSLTWKRVVPEQMFGKSFDSDTGRRVINTKWRHIAVSRPREILRISLCVTEYTEVAQCRAPPSKKAEGTSLNLTAHINSRERVSFRRYKSGTASKGVSPDVRSRRLRFSGQIYPRRLSTCIYHTYTLLADHIAICPRNKLIYIENFVRIKSNSFINYLS